MEESDLFDVFSYFVSFCRTPNFN